MKWQLVLILLLLAAGCIQSEEAFQVENATPQEVQPQQKVPGKAGLTVEKILSNPVSFDGKKVTLEGVATPGLAFQFIEEQPYQLDDGTGKIWVITTQEMPPEGARVRVTGVVVVPYQIKGRHYEVAILEEEREEL